MVLVGSSIFEASKIKVGALGRSSLSLSLPQISKNREEKNLTFFERRSLSLSLSLQKIANIKRIESSEGQRFFRETSRKRLLLCLENFNFFSLLLSFLSSLLYSLSFLSFFFRVEITNKMGVSF